MYCLLLERSQDPCYELAGVPAVVAVGAEEHADSKARHSLEELDDAWLYDASLPSRIYSLAQS